MACAHAKWTGEVGVCLATSGPGAVHLLNGLYDAKLDHQPVFAIVGQQALPALGGSYQQEIDLASLFKDVAHEFVEMASDPTQMRHLVDRGGADREGSAHRHLSDRAERPRRDGGGRGAAPPARDDPLLVGVLGARSSCPVGDDIARAAEILNAGERVAMLVGAGALGAADEVIETAELLGAGVAKALLGKAALPDALPFVTGAIGLLGTKPSWDMMMGCDTLLMVGSSFPYSEFLPEEGKARGVQIDLDGRMIGIRYPMEAQLIGDAKATLRALIPLLERKSRARVARADRGAGSPRGGELIEERALADADPLNPQRLFFELSKRLPERVILSSDSGSAANWFARDIRLRDRDDGVALGESRDDGARSSLRDRRQVRLSRSGRGRPRRRRRVPDERDERADHDRQVLAGAGRIRAW